MLQPVDSGIAELRGTSGTIEEVGHEVDLRRLGDVDAADEAGGTGSAISERRRLADFDVFARAEISYRKWETKVCRAYARFVILLLVS
jgi:hypothetical protein